MQLEIFYQHKPFIWENKTNFAEIQLSKIIFSVVHGKLLVQYLKKFLINTVFPYLEKVKEEKCIPKEQYYLVTIDTFKGQDNDIPK